MDYTKLLTRLDAEDQAALARVVSDLVLADCIIELNEVDRFNEIFHSLKNKDVFYNAKCLTLEQAVKRLKNVAHDFPFEIDNLINGIVSCDGMCAPEEARLLLAFRYYFSSNKTITQGERFVPRYEIISVPRTELDLGNQFVLFIDSTDSLVNFHISQEYNLLSNLLNSIGFQLIHIPNIVALYTTNKGHTFRTMVRYLFPEIDEKEVDQVYDSIKSMTTQSFVRDHLVPKMKFDVANTGPALLVMLGADSVICNHLSENGISNKRYVNMLKINLKDNIRREHQDDSEPLEFVEKFVLDYKKVVAYNHQDIDFNPIHDKMLYKGMYRVFFDLVALAQHNPNHPRIDIDTQKHSILINQRKVDVSPAEAARYILMLLLSISGDRKGLPKKRLSNGLLSAESIQSYYEQIYALFICQECTSLVSIYNALSVRMSHIRAEIHKISDKAELFEDDNRKKTHYVVSLPIGFVYVDGEPLAESPFYEIIVPKMKYE